MPVSLEERLFRPGRKRVLALDGGGVRGIITIAFLKKIEELLARRSGRGDDFRLCEYFDLVGGTSVGSLIATLVALGYSMAEVEQKFRLWAPEIFRRPWLGIPGLSPRFSARGLKRRAREVLGERTLESADFRTGLAIITKRIDTGSPWILSNNPRGKYWGDPPDGSYLGNKNYRVADLVRASTAAPYYFAPKRIRVVAKEKRPRVDPGLFVDGGVSPYNNPAVMLLMLAGMKAYGMQWKLGANQLFLTSVGTGSFRTPLKPGFLLRRIPPYFAAKALQGLVNDSDVLSLTLLQWLSAPKRPWEINSEIGTMQGELLGQDDDQGGPPKPMLSFLRYDARLEGEWLLAKFGTDLGRVMTSDYIGNLQQLDRPDMVDELFRIGALAAKQQVGDEDFPESFDVSAGGAAQVPARATTSAPQS